MTQKSILSEVEVQKQNCTIAILGFAIDPYRPEATNQEIADTLVKCQSKTDFFKSLEVLTGKYAIFYVSKEDELFVLN